jgi:hypothetical protein
MNERIKELVKQAISEVDYIRDDEFTNIELQKMYIPDCFSEKFAQLIVGECCSAADDWYHNANKIHWDPAQHIRNHFGVE